MEDRMSRVVFAIALISLLAPSQISAAPQPEAERNPIPAADSPRAADLSSNRDPPNRALIRELIEQESTKAGLPADLAEAVVFVESDYNSSLVGKVGEIGLMQVRPETAAMLGFRGSLTELAKPEINIHYGVTYLAEAWRLANGDLCRALMKYRAGHGEEKMSPRSEAYCSRARGRLAALHSTFTVPTVGSSAPNPIGSRGAPTTTNIRSTAQPMRPRDVYAHYKQGTQAASRAFWAAHEARIRAMSKRLEARWRSASR
jgi:hypothetical protein